MYSGRLAIYFCLYVKVKIMQIVAENGQVRATIDQVRFIIFRDMLLSVVNSKNNDDDDTNNNNNNYYYYQSIDRAIDDRTINK